MRNLRIIMGLTAFFILSTVQASSFQCAVELVKATCWKDYDVSVHVVSSTWPNIENKLTIPKGKMMAKREFSCRAMDSVSANASFSPAIWENAGNEKYRQKKRWFVPNDLPAGSDTFLIEICFPRDFAGVPLPLGDARNCGCYEKPKDDATAKPASS